MIANPHRIRIYSKTRLCLALFVTGTFVVAGVGAAMAQSGWSTGTSIAPESSVPGGSTTRTPTSKSGTSQQGVLRLEAYLTAEPDVTNRRAINRGLVWRIYSLGGRAQPAKLLMTRREATPTVNLPPGRYAINAAFGRAYLTEMVDVKAGERAIKPFVLNAGGLRVIVKVAGGASASANTARYDIFSDERDQSGNRRRVVTNARPGLITRLNSGIYHIVSRLGDANAQVAAEVAVEAGKLTEAVVSHEAAKVTFKLVQRERGEALADTEWVIMTKAGTIVKESAGALPTHMLAPGSYSVSAKRDGRLYTRTFAVASGDQVEVEVLMQ